MIDIDNDVTCLINDIGKTLFLTRKENEEYDPNTGESTSIDNQIKVQGMFLNYNDKLRVDGNSIQAGDRKAVLSATGMSYAPSINDIVDDGTNFYRIINIRTIEVRNKPITYICQVRA